MKYKAYTDGSYFDSVWGSAVVILDEMNNPVVYLTDSGIDTEGIRNIKSELTAAMKAIGFVRRFLNDGDTELVIYHDLEGIQKWADKQWGANKKSTQKYQCFVEEARKDIKVSFIKVKAHSGIEFNEKVDKLAKNAVEFFHNRTNKETIKKTIEREATASVSAGYNLQINGQIAF